MAMHQLHRLVEPWGRLRNPARRMTGLLVAVVMLAGSAARADDLQRLAGVWVFDALKVEVRGTTQNSVERVWTSTVTISGDTFSLSDPMGLSKPITGKI